jgi:Leucine-rich repeat (LRR) protein
MSTPTHVDSRLKRPPPVDDDDNKHSQEKKACCGNKAPGDSVVDRSCPPQHDRLKEAALLVFANPVLMNLVLLYLKNSWKGLASLSGVCQAYNTSTRSLYASRNFSLHLSWFEGRIPTNVLRDILQTKVSKLHLTDTNLSELPTGIGALQQVKEIDCFFDRNSTLPTAQFTRLFTPENMPALKSLTFRGDRQGYPLFRNSGLAPQIQEIHFKHCPGFRSLYTSHENLTSLKIEGCRNVDFALIADFLRSRAQKLETFVFRKGNLDSKTFEKTIFEAIKDLKQPSTLKHLDFSENRMFSFPPGISEFLEKCPSLKVFKVSKTHILDCGEWIKALADCCPNLKILDVSQNGYVPMEDLIELVKNCRQMKYLMINNHQEVTDEHLRRFHKANSHLMIQTAGCPEIKATFLEPNEYL